MHCTKCGNKLVGDNKYCGGCGAQISDLSNAKGQDFIVENSKDMENLPESYIAKIIYEKSQRRLYLGYFLLASAIIIFIYQHNYIANLISGPRSIDETTLENELISGNIKDININLQLSPDSVYQAGYTHITQTVDQATNKVESETTDAEYYMTVIGKHILVLEGSPNKIPSGNFEGVVDSMPTELHNNLISDFNSDPELQEFSTSILPYVVSNKGMTGLDAFWSFLFGLLLFGIGGFITWKRATDKKDEKHYVYQVASLSGYKSINELSDDFLKAEKEGTTKIGGYKLSNKFLFENNYFSFKIYPLSQMYWSYKKIIKKRVNFIPTGKDYEVVMHFRPNKTVSIKEPEESVNNHLMLLVKLCPEARFGYTK